MYALNKRNLLVRVRGSFAGLRGGKVQKTMLNRFTFAMLITAIICTLGRTPAFARLTIEPYAKPNQTRTFLISKTDKPVPVNIRLREGIKTLVADAKAGKMAPSANQMQPATRNNLSKGKKIAIGVGIAVAVVAIVLIIQKPRLTGPKL